MGKINKYSNIYDKEYTGDNAEEHIIRHVGDSGVLQNYTLEELEALVDKLGNDKDESGRIRNKQAFDNASFELFKYYQKYGNPHEKEIIEALKSSKQRPTEEQVKDALTDVLDETANVRKETVMDEYVNYEEVKIA